MFVTAWAILKTIEQRSYSWQFNVPREAGYGVKLTAVATGVNTAASSKQL